MRKTFLFFFTLLWFNSAVADDSSCLSASASKGSGATEVKVVLKQHQFDQGQQDLAMEVVGPVPEFKRITYGGTADKACRYFPVQVSQGADWGWHMLWREASGLYYSRMDGEAWVSTPPKQIAEGEVSEPVLVVKGAELTINWKQAGAHWQSQSFSEGKSWRDRRPYKPE